MADLSGPRRRTAVLVEDFVDVRCGIEEIVCPSTEREQWLTGLVGEAEGDGEATIAGIGGPWAAALLQREARATIGAWRLRGDALVGWIRWEPADNPESLPFLDGDLVLTPLREACRITLSASYYPPLDSRCRTRDWPALHLIAQSTVRAFLRRLALRLEEQVDVAEVERRAAHLG